MSQANPWGENWQTQYYSSAEMEALLDQAFGEKCVSMGFQPAGKRKWIKTRTNGVMEVVYIHSDRGFQYYPSFGLSFPWIPHGDWKKICWHRTPKLAVIDLGHQSENQRSSFVWAISKERASTIARAESVATELCSTCGPWFNKFVDDDSIYGELKRRRKSPFYYNFVQALTVDLFWQARMRDWNGFDDRSEKALSKYFGEEEFQKLRQLIEKIAAENSDRS